MSCLDVCEVADMLHGGDADQEATGMLQSAFGAAKQMSVDSVVSSLKGTSYIWMKDKQRMSLLQDAYVPSALVISNTSVV